MTQTPRVQPWTLGETDSRPIIRRAIDLGINSFDTANSYSADTSETIIGKLLREFGRRDELVVATKVFLPERMMDGGAAPRGPAADA